MTCNEVRQHWMLYLDSEGDPEMHFRISDHLGMCPECADWFARQEHFERCLTKCLKRDPNDSVSWERVLRRAGLGPATGRGRRKMVLNLASLAVVLGLGAIAWRLSEPPPEKTQASLTQMTIDCHERHLQGVSLVEFRSQDNLAVKTYIRQRVPFEVNVPAGKGSAFALEGGGVCRWAPQPMAYFVGRLEQSSVSVFVLAEESLDAFPEERDRLLQGGGRCRFRERDYEVVTWLAGSNVVVAVGTAPPESLEQLLDVYGH